MSTAINRLKTGYLIVSLVVFFSVPCLAASVNSNWFARSWQANDGLPDDTVVGVAQTPDGFLWVATQGGLARFDGFSFRDYQPAVDAGLPTSVIETILLDHVGRLWLAKSGGRLVCLEAGRTKAFSTADGLLNLRAMVTAEDGEGAIWISYAGGSLVRFFDGRVRRFTTQDGLPRGGSCRIISDKHGQLWFVKGGRIGLFRQGKLLTLLRLEANTIRLASSRSSGVWICADRSFYKFNEGKSPAKLGELPTPLSDVKPTDIYEDHTGAVWIGTEQAGLFRYADSVFTKVEGLQYEIWSVTEDREGNIWVGTRGGGLNRLRPAAVELVDVGSAVPFDAVQSLCQSPNGDLWAVTRNGALTRNQGNGWRAMSKEDGWPAVDASCVSTGPDNAVWVGTKHSGLKFWRPGSVTNLTNISGLNNMFVCALLTAPSGEVWIGTDQPSTLQRLHNGTLKLFQIPTNAESIRAMTVDGAGNFWAGTSDGILLRVTRDQVINETPNTLTVPQPIQSLATTADGSLWIGYGGSGLGRLKGKRFNLFGVEEGLYEGHISQIVPDGHGRIWLAGNRGIFYVSEKEFDDVAEGRSTSLFSVTFGKNAGAPGSQTSRGYWPGALRATDGRLMIPKVKGLAIVHAEALRPKPLPPRVVLDRVVVDGRTVAAYDPSNPGAAAMQLAPMTPGPSNLVLRLSPGFQQVRFDYTSPSFADPENLRFKYKLNGLDDDWVDARERRVAYYPRLSPGNYVFQVRACTADGVWNESGAALEISVPPFFWQTWWFRILVPAVALAAVGIIVRSVEKRRIKLQFEQAEREHTLERERARIARDIHDDLGANLTEISLLSEIAQGTGASAQEMQADVRRIGTMARALTVSLSEIVWAVNPRNDNFESFVTYACNYAEDYLRRVGIRCRLEMPTKLPGTIITSEMRHNLFLVIKEALNNIVKHAQASEVRMSFALEDNGFKLTIKDNGKGIHPLPTWAEFGQERDTTAPRVNRGNGLVNMRDRVKSMGGRIHLSNPSVGGAKVELTVPFGTEHQK